MNLPKFAAIVCSILVIAGCSTLDKWEEDMGLFSESANQHASIDKSTIKRERIISKLATFPTSSNQPVVNPKVTTKRINTTACKDSDDWYLDGYRVGKSFQTQKLRMLQQRSEYCGYNVKQLPAQYRSNWDRGFLIGTKS
ncbi:hypothetical protein [Mannheimia granulomatis]|uniref:hypothetical protein n=1 Tax=Mannheimia granulomatis TaxID=85402 RepID=UPI00067B760A|nr:hypothetical protein [Mannheimia granulomatis]QLB18806.1 hypothetical protein A6B41_04775 [Mannheimia granulomatis]